MHERLAIDGGTPIRDETLPIFRVSYGYEELREVLEVFESGIFCSVDPGARKVPGLEAAFAEYAGTEHAVAFNSGTTAQHASLVAAGVGPGDEVIVPPLTFMSTAYTAFMVGAVPVFADVDDNTITIDPQRVAEAITPRTRAIVPVHWFGHPAAMDELLELAREYELAVIEDCAHANGAVYRGRKVGTIGDMSCWSLQQSKVLTSAGEGGMLATNDEGLARVARSVGDHGKDKAARSRDAEAVSIVRLGNNYRLSEIQAAFALAQLRKAERIGAARKAHSEYLDSGLSMVPGLRRPKPWPDVQPGHPYYPVRFDVGHFRADLDQISDALNAEGIGTSKIAQGEFCPAHPLFRENCGPFNLPVAERIMRELLLLPLYPDLTRPDLDDVVAAVNKVATAYTR